MPKVKISEFSPTPANNTDIDGINIAEGCAPSGINDAIRELMAQLKDFQAGTAGDSFNGPVGTSTAVAGAFTTLSASGAVTLSGGTANGVPYLNGSKVVTSGSALTFDGTNLGIGTTSPATGIELKGLSPSINVNGTVTSDFRGYSIRANGTEIASMLSEASFGENRITAGFSGFGGFQTFYTNGLERARINSSGDFLVGTTSFRGAGGTSFEGATLHSNTATTGFFARARFATNNTDVGFISTNGSGTTYSTSSDYRLKEDVQPMRCALARIAELKPVTYKWKVDGSNGQGFIAHELQAVVPECVTGKKDAVDEHGNPQYQGIDTSFLVATLTAAIQEQQALIQALTTRVAALETN
jgi:hypothetical protein